MVFGRHIASVLVPKCGLGVQANQLADGVLKRNLATKLLRSTKGFMRYNNNLYLDNFGLN